ncbi:MAG TPA: alanine racemase, partial [Treponemataceae bacterium]|nr:alanine racemase [Treponemataceae bacterium]
MKKIAEKYKKIRSQIDTFAEKANRSSEKIKLMTVSKFHSENEIIEAIKGGAEFFGENRVQEAVQKFPQILNEYPNVQLHFIGQLQTNKVKQIVEYASCIQSVDRLKLLEEIEKRAKAINKKIDILFEVHTAEESKSGFRDIHM